MALLHRSGAGWPHIPFPIRFRSAITSGGGGLFQLNYIIDDGAVFYLNGVEIHLNGVAAGQTYTTPASRTIGDALLEGPVNLLLPSLRKGENVLAVEVHQVNGTSSDVVFGAELSMDAVPSIVSPTLVFTWQTGGSLSLSWDAESSLILQQSLSVTGPWVNVPAQSNPLLVESRAGQLPAAYFRLKSP